MAEKTAWAEKQPLSGKRVLITRARSQASELARLIESFGGEVYECPLIRLAPPDDWGPVDQALQALETFEWIVFTSANGVEFFFQRMRELRIDIRRIRGKIAVVGPATDQALRAKGLLADLVPELFVAGSLLAALTPHVGPGSRILLPRADIARKELPDGLRQIGCEVTEVDVYQNLPVYEHAEAVTRMLKDGRIHAITFTSSSTVKHFVKILAGEDLPALLAGVTIASIGPITTETAEKLGLRVDVTAKTHTIPGLVEALVGLLNPRAKDVGL